MLRALGIQARLARVYSVTYCTLFASVFMCLRTVSGDNDLFQKRQGVGPWDVRDDKRPWISTSRSEGAACAFHEAIMQAHMENLRGLSGYRAAVQR